MPTGHYDYWTKCQVDNMPTGQFTYCTKCLTDKLHTKQNALKKYLENKMPSGQNAFLDKMPN
jgi:hypothetical protein